MCPTKGCYYVKDHSGACAPTLQADLVTVKEGVVALREERDRLLAELAEARKDTERLDWLVDKMSLHEDHLAVSIESGRWFWEMDISGTDYDTPRAAIDAARAKL